MIPDRYSVSLKNDKIVIRDTLHPESRIKFHTSESNTVKLEAFGGTVEIKLNGKDYSISASKLRATLPELIPKEFVESVITSIQSTKDIGKAISYVKDLSERKEHLKELASTDKNLTPADIAFVIKLCNDLKSNNIISKETIQKDIEEIDEALQHVIPKIIDSSKFVMESPSHNEPAGERHLQLEDIDLSPEEADLALDFICKAVLETKNDISIDKRSDALSLVNKEVITIIKADIQTFIHDNGDKLMTGRKLEDLFKKLENKLDGTTSDDESENIVTFLEDWKESLDETEIEQPKFNRVFSTHDIETILSFTQLNDHVPVHPNSVTFGNFEDMTQMLIKDKLPQSLKSLNNYLEQQPIDSNKLDKSMLFHKNNPEKLQSVLKSTFEQLENKSSYDIDDVDLLLKIAEHSNKNGFSIISTEAVENITGKLKEMVDTFGSQDNSISLLIVFQQFAEFTASNKQPNDFNGMVAEYHHEFCTHLLSQISDLNIKFSENKELAKADISYVMQLNAILESSKDPEMKNLNTALQPAITIAKTYLKNHPQTRSRRTSSNIGASSTAGISTIAQLISKGETAKTANVSVNEVILRPKEGASLKKLEPGTRGAEDEAIIQHLFSFLSPNDALIYSSRLQVADRSRFGIPAETDQQLMRFELSSINISMLKHIEKQLTTEAEDLYDSLAGAAAYATLREQPVYLWDGTKEIKMTYQDLKQNLRENKIDKSSNIRLEGHTDFYTIDEIAGAAEEFSDFLDYNPNINYGALAFVPHLEHEADRKVLEAAAKEEYYREDEDGERVQISFSRVFEGFVSATEEEKNKIFKEDGTPAYTPQLNNTLQNLKWSLDNSLAMVQNPAIVSPARAPADPKVIADVQVKVFAQNMQSLHDLAGSIPLREGIMKRIDPKYQLDLALTAQLQFLDLHSKNLGFVPIPNDNFKKFQDCKISCKIGSSIEDKSFIDLLHMHLKGELPDTAEIFVEDADGDLTIETLKDWGDLKDALEVKWKPVLFDTDMVLSESNNFISYRNMPMIPLRSHLLATEFSDAPFADETVDQLLDTTQDLKAIDWINHSDAPILKRLKNSPDKSRTEMRQEIAQALKPLVERDAFAISPIRNLVTAGGHKNTHYPLSALKKTFANDLSKLDNPEKVSFWTKLDGFITPPMNLTADTPEAAKKRVIIAKQLAPRITWKQRDAYVERMDRRIEYLSNYKHLAKTTGSIPEELGNLDRFLNSKTFPLASTEKQIFLDEFETLKSNPALTPAELADFKSRVLKVTTPSYEKLTKAMYPHLADALKLNRILYGQEKGSKLIGDFGHTLDKSVMGGLSQDPASEAYKLAYNLDQAIKAEPNRGSL